MKSCLDCKYADWKRTESGRLHPSGDGKCKYEWKSPQLPQSMYWIARHAPSPCGGNIERKKELEDHCAYFSKASK